MSNLAQAGQAVSNLAKQYASVITLGKELERIGSIEQYETELNARVESLKKYAEDREREAVEAKARLDEALLGFQKEHRQVLEHIAREARQAEAVAGEAVAQAVARQREAEQHAQRAQDDFTSAQGVYQARIAAYEEQLNKSQEKLNAVQAEIEAVRAKFKE